MATTKRPQINVRASTRQIAAWKEAATTAGSFNAWAVAALDAAADGPPAELEAAAEKPKPAKPEHPAPADPALAAELAETKAALAAALRERAALAEQLTAEVGEVRGDLGLCLEERADLSVRLDEALAELDAPAPVVVRVPGDPVLVEVPCEILLCERCRNRRSRRRCDICGPDATTP